MAGVNKVILLGNLGSDPEVRHLENGSAVARFNIATSENYSFEQNTMQQCSVAAVQEHFLEYSVTYR